MADEVAPPGVTVAPTDSLYRGINPIFYQDGELLSGVFLLKKAHKLEDGPSVGIARLIQLSDFQSLMAANWGVGQFCASDALSLQLRVHPIQETTWGKFADSHAVITDYQKLSDRVRNDVQRALKNILQKNIVIKPS